MATNNNLDDFVNDLASAIRCRSKDFNIMTIIFVEFTNCQQFAVVRLAKKDS